MFKTEQVMTFARLANEGLRMGSKSSVTQKAKRLVKNGSIGQIRGSTQCL